MRKLFILLFFIFYTNLKCNAEVMSLKKFDNLEIEADIINTVRSKQMVIFNGNVIAKQTNNDLKISSIEMNLKYGFDRKTGKVIMRKLYAFGNVTLRKEKIMIIGKECLYDILNNEITMKNDVVLFDDISKINGETVIYNIETGDIQVLGKKEEEQKDEQVTIILEDIDKAKEIYGK